MINRLLLVLPLLLFGLSCSAADEAKQEFVAGVHYDVITPATWTADSSKIELAEFFWYGCGHCYTFEPVIQQWKKSMPEDVSFRGVPAIWRKGMDLHAKAYYTAEAMGVLDKIHPVIFQAMNVDRKRLGSRAEIEELFTANGVDAEKFDKTFDSFGIDSQVRKAQAQGVAAGLTGTPALMVNGKYYIGSRKAGGQAKMLEVANYLIEKERAAAKK
ncbi:MAG: thiol:disulfide interchange protein DsbA/DsbL [Halioglobus sp.]|nr:thiol:disulfide interchange protein DsbA/DsbL [Halioglobus sp.]